MMCMNRNTNRKISFFSFNFFFLKFPLADVFELGPGGAVAVGNIHHHQDVIKLIKDKILNK